MLKTYAYHKPSPAGIERIATMRKAFSELQELLEITVPPSRERSVAITNLEQAHMWANKAIVVNDADSEVDPDGTFVGRTRSVIAEPIGESSIKITREVPA